LDGALAHARTSRAAAVDATDVPTYLAASALLVMIHERRGDLVAALDDIVRARASLRDLLGAPGAGLVEPALTLFEERLGEARFAEVRAAWEASRRAQR